MYRAALTFSAGLLSAGGCALIYREFGGDVAVGVWLVYAALSIDLILLVRSDDD